MYHAISLRDCNQFSPPAYLYTVMLMCTYLSKYVLHLYLFCVKGHLIPCSMKYTYSQSDEFHNII